MLVNVSFNDKTIARTRVTNITYVTHNVRSLYVVTGPSRLQIEYRRYKLVTSSNATEIPAASAAAAQCRVGDGLRLGGDSDLLWLRGSGGSRLRGGSSSGSGCTISSKRLLAHA